MTDAQLIFYEVRRARLRLKLAGIPFDDAAQAAQVALVQTDTPYRTTVIRRAIIDEIDRWTGCWRKGLGGTKQHLPLNEAPDVPSYLPDLDHRLDRERRWRRAMRLSRGLPPTTGRVIRRYLRGQSHEQIAAETGLSVQMVWHYRRQGIAAMQAALRPPKPPKRRWTPTRGFYYETRSET